MCPDSIHADHDTLALVPVREFMTSPVVSIPPTATLKIALQTLVNKKITGIPVVNESEQLIGVVTECDLLLQAAVGTLSRPVQFSKGGDSISPDCTLKDVLVKMVKARRKWLPVVSSSGHVEGVIARRDLLKVMLQRSGE